MRQEARRLSHRSIEAELAATSTTNSGGPGRRYQPGATNSANYDPAKANPFPEFGGPSKDPPSTEQLLAAGWGYATINPGSILADNGAGLTKGIIGLVNKGQPRKPDDWVDRQAQPVFSVPLPHRLENGVDDWPLAARSLDQEWVV